MIPTAVDGIHFVDAVACMCSAAAGMFGADAVLVLPDIHCLLDVGAATATVVGLAANVAASAAGADKPTIAAVAAPTESETFISGSTNTAAEPNIPAAAEHIHATVATKWIPATAVGTT